MPEKICIAGLGQMGASLAMAIKHFNPDSRVCGWSPCEEEIGKALEKGIIDSGSTSAEKELGDADLTILCMPVEPLIKFAKDNCNLFKKGSIVSDISSVKSIIVDEVRPVLNEAGVHFVGSHPMSGSEKSGMDNASALLYENTVIFICSYCTDDPAAIAIVREFWRDIGAKPFEVDAVEHDETVASTSHILHISSSVATHIALEGDKYDLAKLACAGAFRDSTRIAGSCPKMWRDITKTNKSAILKTMQKTIDELESIKQAVSNDDWDEIQEYLERGRELRNKWWEDCQNIKS